MRQSKIIAINTVSNWLGMFANSAVLIFLAKFLLGKIGIDQFGMFQYVLTMQGSLMFLDLGLGATLNRFVSRLLVVYDVKRLNAAISFTSLLFFGLGIIAAIVLTGIGFFLPLLIPGGTTALYKSGFVLMICMGANLGIRFWGYTPRGVLYGKQRYYMVSIIHTVTVILRATSIVALFSIIAPAGLIIIGLCFLATSFFETLLLWVFSKQQFPQMELGLRFIDKNIMRDIFGFSSYVMILGITTMLIACVPTFLAGRFYGPEAVAYISLSMLVLNQLERVSGGFAPVLIPVAGKYGALNNKKNIQKIMVIGTKFCALMCFPLATMAVIFSKPLFEWFKPGFGWTWVLLAIMVFPRLLRTTQRVSASVLMGAGSIKWLAIGQSILVPTIVILSWLFAFHFDMKLIGIALGPAIPILIYTITLHTAYACHQTELKWLSYMYQSYGRIIFGLVPALTAALIMLWYLYPRGLLMIIAEASLALIIYAITAWLFILSKDDRVSIYNLFKYKKISPVVESL